MNCVHEVIEADAAIARHGYVRVIVRHPYLKYLHTGMPRLTCSHLVKEIDKLEASQGVRRYNSILAATEDLQENFRETMKEWNDILKSVLTDEDIERCRSQIGRENTDSRLNMGLIGISMNKYDDVKCLHANVADYLLRGKNKIGKLVLDELEQSSVNTSGCDGKINILFLLFRHKLRLCDERMLAAVQFLCS